MALSAAVSSIAMGVMLFVKWGTPLSMVLCGWLRVWGYIVPHVWCMYVGGAAAVHYDKLNWIVVFSRPIARVRDLHGDPVP